MRYGHRLMPFWRQIFFSEVRQIPSSLATAFSGMLKNLDSSCMESSAALCSGILHPWALWPRSDRPWVLGLGAQTQRVPNPSKFRGAHSSPVPPCPRRARTDDHLCVAKPQEGVDGSSGARHPGGGKAPPTLVGAVSERSCGTKPDGRKLVYWPESGPCCIGP